MNTKDDFELGDILVGISRTTDGLQVDHVFGKVAGKGKDGLNILRLHDSVTPGETTDVLNPGINDQYYQKPILDTYYGCFTAKLNDAGKYTSWEKKYGVKTWGDYVWERYDATKDYISNHFENYEGCGFWE